MKKISKTTYNNIIWCLTVLLLLSFAIFNQYTWGSLVMFSIIGLILVCMLICDKGKISLEFSKFYLYIIVFALFCMASSLWAKDKFVAIEKGITVFSLFITYAILFMFYYRFLSVDRLLKAILWSGYLVVIYSIYSFGIDNIIATFMSGSRLPNKFTNINGLAIVASFSFVIDAYYALYREIKVRNVLMLPTFIFILATASRKALVFVVVGVALLVFIKVAMKNFVKAIALLLIMILGALAVYNLMGRISIFSGLVERIDSLIMVVFKHEGGVSGDVWRVAYQEVGIEQFFKTPIWGIGIDNSYLITSPLGRETYLHNNYIELLACGGLVGFLIYYSIYFYIFYNLFKYKDGNDSLSIICIVLAILILIMDFGMVTYYDKSNYFYILTLFLHSENVKYKAIRRKEKSDMPTRNNMVAAFN